MPRAVPATLGCLALLFVATAPAPVLADAAGLAPVNAAREGACRMPGAARLASSRSLDEAARAMAEGRPLGEALRGAGYRADEAVSIRVAGGAGPERLRQVMEQRFCDDVGNTALTEGGVARRGHEIWFVLARPFAPPPASDQPKVAARVLALVNEARAVGRRCGRQSLPPVPPLVRDRQLDAVALAHSRDQASRGVLTHEGADGTRVGARVQHSGYAAERVGENVAAGATTPEEVVQGWLDSPGHCANLMDGRYTRMGLGYAVARDSPGGIYWTQVFAARH